MPTDLPDDDNLPMRSMHCSPPVHHKSKLITLQFRFEYLALVVPTRSKDGFDLDYLFLRLLVPFYQTISQKKSFEFFRCRSITIRLGNLRSPIMKRLGFEYCSVGCHSQILSLIMQQMILVSHTSCTIDNKKVLLWQQLERMSTSLPAIYRWY